MTVKAARAALAAQITTAVNDPTVSVLAYEPPSLSGDVITVVTAGVTDTEYRLQVRIYVDAVQSAEGQDRLDDLLEAVEGNALSDLPRSAWEWVYNQAESTFQMVTTIDYPREDF